VGAPAGPDLDLGSRAVRSLLAHTRLRARLRLPAGYVDRGDLRLSRRQQSAARCRCRTTARTASTTHTGAAPRAYLDESVRANISVFWRLDPGEVADGIARLRADLESGRWHERNAELLELPDMDYGYVLLVRELR